jgi:hypothetical protein
LAARRAASYFVTALQFSKLHEGGAAKIQRVDGEGFAVEMHKRIC